MLLFFSCSSLEAATGFDRAADLFNADGTCWKSSFVRFLGPPVTKFRTVILILIPALKGPETSLLVECKTARAGGRIASLRR